jgi:hypothetical protein
VARELDRRQEPLKRSSLPKTQSRWPPAKGSSIPQSILSKARCRSTRVAAAQGEWRVEYFDDDGGCYVAIFADPAAERRARDYFASLKSGRLKKSDGSDH